MASVYEGAKEGLESFIPFFHLNTGVIVSQFVLLFTFRFDFVKVKVNFNPVHWWLFQPDWEVPQRIRTKW